MDGTTRNWKLDDLAREAGVSPRTVRYYVQRGLIPAPEFRGRDTAYTDHHLRRLRAVRQLQQRLLPLDAIEAELGVRSEAEIDALARGEDLPEAARPPVPDAASATARVPAPRVERWERHPVVEGVEVHVSERVAEAVRDEVREWVREFERRRGRQGARR